MFYYACLHGGPLDGRRVPVSKNARWNRYPVLRRAPAVWGTGDFGDFAEAIYADTGRVDVDRVPIWDHQN